MQFNKYIHTADSSEAQKVYLCSEFSVNVMKFIEGLGKFSRLRFEFVLFKSG